jgi:hypothetical protein
MIAPFKKRRVNYRKPVEVYRNLLRDSYSVRQGGLVVGHTKAIMICDATFVVNAAGHKRYKDSGVRNVHAWVRGTISLRGAMGTSAEEAWTMPRVHYKLHDGRFFIGGPWRPITGAWAVALNERGAFAAYTVP